MRFLPQPFEGKNPDDVPAGFGADIDADLKKRLPAILYGLGALYVFSVFHLSVAVPGATLLLKVAAAVSGALCLSGCKAVRQRWFRPTYAHPVGAGVALLVLCNALLQLVHTGEPQHSLQLALLLLAAGFILLSTRWLLALLAISLMSWCVVASVLLNLGDWVSFCLSLLIAAAVSYSLHRARLQSRIQQYADRAHAREQQRQLREGEQRFELAVRGANDGLWYWDLKSDEVYYSPRWLEMLGYAEGELSTSSSEWFDRVHPYYLPGLRKALEDHLSGGARQFESKYRIRLKDGSYRWVFTRGLAERDSDGRPTRIAGSQTDITELIEVEQRLLHEALHDKLTGLPNRSFFMKQLQNALASGKLVAVLFMDLDRFKMINDTLGHPIGDRLIVAAADRLRACQRSGDTVARLGGDEFVVLLNGLRAHEDAEVLASKIREAMSWPFKLSGHRVVTSASIGIALTTTNASPEDLLRDADIAMYQSKRRGTGQISVFDDSMRQSIVSSWHLQNDLRQAVEKRELELHYQPLVSLKSGKMTGVEALLRWRGERGALLTTDELISLAEETGLIDGIGEWVLETACAQNKMWQDAGLRPLRVSVNLSGRQLKPDSLPALVERVLRDTGLSPGWLELELTETAVVDRPEEATSCLNAIAGLGVRLAIDDFGRGQSSLGQLNRFPFQALKIDRSFVAAVGRDQQASTLARGLISLAHGLQLEVTAEGVETQEQMSFLRANGCDRLQGFLASPAVTAARLAELLESDQPLLELPAGPTQNQLAAVLSGRPGRSLLPAGSSGHRPSGASHERRSSRPDQARKVDKGTVIQ